MESFRFRVERVEEEVRGLRDQGAWHLQEHRGSLIEPGGSYAARDVESCHPIRRQIGFMNHIEFEVRPFDAKQSEIRGNVVCSGVDTDFKQSAGRTISEVDNGVSSMVPSSSCFQSADAAEIFVTTDSPENHSDEHAFIDLDEEFFDDAAAGIGPEERKGRSVFEARMRSPQPGQCALAVSINSFRRGKNAQNSQHTVRLLYGQLLAARAAMLKGARGDDHFINLRALEAQRNKPLDYRRGELTFDDVKNLGFSGRSPEPQPFADMAMRGVHSHLLHYAIQNPAKCMWVRLRSC